MWTVVYIAPNTKEAEKVKNVLNEGGFLVKVKPVGLIMTSQRNPIEILVPELEAEEAIELITKM